MAGLLVSVRSASEALDALRAGASVIDVKEPSRGPLGRADESVWGEVLDAVEGRAPVSVALGELKEWSREPEGLDRVSFTGLSFRKLGLAGEAPCPDWPARWSDLRGRLHPGPSWVAVIYADWVQAHAPEPEAVLDEALRAGCSGLLIDTFDKSEGNSLVANPFWVSLLSRARGSGLFLAVAGRVDSEAMTRLAPLEPTLFAVRGAACRGGDRLSPIDSERVARLVRMAHSLS